jgi:hypothetical protein
LFGMACPDDAKEAEQESEEDGRGELEPVDHVSGLGENEDEESLKSWSNGLEAVT